MIWWRRETHSLEQWRLMAFNYRAKRERRQIHFFYIKTSLRIARNEKWSSIYQQKAEIEADILMGDLQSENIFHKKAERPEWMNILGFSVINDGIMKNVPKFISLGAAKRKEKIYLCYYEMISLINHFTVYRFNLSSFYYPLTSLALFKWVIRFWLPYTRDFLPAHFWF